jgi:iron complex outermembrane receptor protein
MLGESPASARPRLAGLFANLARAVPGLRNLTGPILLALLLFTAAVAALPASAAAPVDRTPGVVPATDTIRVVDETTNDPIVGLTYRYGDQTGVSGRDGVLTLEVEPDTPLHLSHVRYGAWTLSAGEVTAALRRGTIRRAERVTQMHPMTVVGVRGDDDPTQTLSIDAEERLAHDGGALLDRMPEISSVKKSGSYGFDPVLRGFKNDRLTVLVNGAPSAIAACPNRMDPPTSQVAPNMMDRVEIRKGPHSLRFGPSFGGTINFVPVEPTFSASPETYGRLSGSYERNGTVARSEGLVGVRNRSYDLGLYGAWSEGNDYDPGTAGSVPADFQRTTRPPTLRRPATHPHRHPQFCPGCRVRRPANGPSQRRHVGPPRPPRR